MQTELEISEYLTLLFIRFQLVMLYDSIVEIFAVLKYISSLLGKHL